MKKTFTIVTCLLFTFFQVKSSDGQIIYTDIEDVTLECTNNGCYESYNLDLNNDNTIDYVLYASAPNGFYQYHFIAGLVANNGNGTITLLNFPEPYPLKKNFLIGNIIPSNYSLSWGWSGILSEKFYYCCQYGPCPKHLCKEYKNGSWTQPGDYFLGVKINVNDQFYYGWARLSVRVTNKQAIVTLKDYAYESTPGVTILAGDTGASPTVKFQSDTPDEETNGLFKTNIYPNPVASIANVSFSLSKVSRVLLMIYDMNGQQVKTVADKQFNEGFHKVSFETNDMSSGIYMLRLQSGEFFETKKIVVVK